MKFALLLPLLLVVSLALDATAAEPAGDAPEKKTLVWPDGTRYVGGVEDGKRSGKGTIFWQDGTRFVGTFRNDMRDGPGTMILPDGTVYNGFFREDKLIEAPAEPAAPVSDVEIAEAEAAMMAEVPASEQQIAVVTEPAAEAEELEAAMSIAEVTAITEDVRGQLTEMIDLWAAAWSEQNVPQYLDYYASEFDPGDMSRAAWENLRRRRLARPAYIELDLSFEDFELVEPNVVDVTFKQVYRSDVYADETTKTLTLTREGPFWRILREETR